MADIVTFDPLNLRITPIDTLGTGNIEISLQEVYSEWKTWVVLSGGVTGAACSACAPPAMRVVGGDPISDLQNLGSTFFLTNGWRFKPNERSHKLTLVGNIFTDPAGDSISVPTDGAYTVTIEQFVSNLVDSSVARLDLTQLLPAVFIDTLAGVSGSDIGIGVPTNPVNNIEDAFIIAERDNLKEFKLKGTIRLTRDAVGFTVEGLETEQSSRVEISGANIDKSRFVNLTLTGSLSGNIAAQNCRLFPKERAQGVFRRCGLPATTELADNSISVFAYCFAGQPGSGTPTIIHGASSSISLRDWSGQIAIASSSTGCNSNIDLDPGSLTMKDCTGGFIEVRGIGEFSEVNCSGHVILTGGLITGVSVQDISGTVNEAADNARLAVALIASK